MGTSLESKLEADKGAGPGLADASSAPDFLLQPLIDLRAEPFTVRGAVIGGEPEGASEGARDALSAARNVARVAGRVPDLDVFVRVGGAALPGEPALLPEFMAEASRAGLLPTRVVFDLSGPIFALPDQGPLLETIDRLRNFGVRVSLSRMGACTEGPQLMLALHPDYFWIPAAAVAGCGTDFYKRAIVESISRLAWKFGALAVAEGVATAADVATARDLGASFALGPWVGPPVNVLAPVGEIVAGNFPFVVKTAGPSVVSAIQNRSEVDR